MYMDKRFKGVIGLTSFMGYMNLMCLFGVGYYWGAKEAVASWSLVGVMILVGIFHFLYEIADEHYKKTEQNNK